MGEDLVTTLNPQYPTSWWGIGFSDEVRAGEVVPVKLLERDVILWRGSDGTLHCHSAICPHLGANIGYGGDVVGNAVRCPFHGHQYDGTGRACARVGNDSQAPKSLKLRTYDVREHFGTIFVWNGQGEPDHDFPLEALLPETTSSEEETSSFRCAFRLPFPGKLFTENVADANHLSTLHRACEWGEVELLEESPWLLKQRLELKNPVRLLSSRYLRDLWDMGQLRNPPISTENGMTMTTFGGGLHLIVIDPFRPGEGGLFGKVLDIAGAVRAITCFTPITANSHWHSVTFVMPKLRAPLPQWAMDRAMNRILAARDWGATVQDCAVMIHRQEPAKPVYDRLDRGLVRFRRFWDSRLEDRSLWEGDGIHSNGLRAGIRWDDAPSAPARVVRRVAQ